jgi:hypothetical protein
MVSSAPSHLLYIEPPARSKSKIPVDDAWTDLMRLAYADAIPGVLNGSNFDPNGRYRGIHTTHCGKTSTDMDYLLRSDQITNALCVFYLRWYRDSIPAVEMEKVRALAAYYKPSSSTNQWSKTDLVLHLFHTFPKYFFPSEKVLLNRNISDKDLGGVIKYFEKEFVDQQTFLSKNYSREVCGMMMDKASGKDAHYAMLTYFDHKGYWIDCGKLTLIKTKYREIIGDGDLNARVG